MQNASPPLLIMLNAFPPLPISFSLSRMQQSIGSAKNQSQICLQIPRQRELKVNSVTTKVRSD
jgi:hypothetical protein